nr:unnamed protein product [Callosobruchus analis]
MNEHRKTKMAITCWAPGCNHNNKRDSCRFFRFPKNKTLLKKWLSLLSNSSRSLDQPNTSVASDELRCSQDDVAAATPSCSGTHTLLEAENYLQGLELERKEKLIKSIGRSMSYIQICDSDNM